MDTLSTVLTWQIIAATVIIYYATRTFYRLFLHPLAQFPGPKLAAVTIWYEGYYDVVQNGQYTSKIAEMHEEYGKQWFDTVDIELADQET